jgi:hypothetical protein
MNSPGGRGPKRWRVGAEGIAVPNVNLIDEVVEGIVEPAAKLLPAPPTSTHPAPQQKSAPHPSPTRPAEAGPRGTPAVLFYPRLDSHVPLGPSPDNPMGEGSEETALPVIDPVDVRLGVMKNPPDPLP